jgi:hypothetical protein
MAGGQPNVMNVVCAELYGNGTTILDTNKTLRGDQVWQINLKLLIELEVLSVNDGEGDRNVIVCTRLIVANASIE